MDRINFFIVFLHKTDLLPIYHVSGYGCLNNSKRINQEIMLKADEQFLEDHREMYKIFQASGVIRHMDRPTLENFLRIARENFDKNYVVDLWCNSCVPDMIKYVFTQYDKEVKAEAETVKPITVKSKSK